MFQVLGRHVLHTFIKLSLQMIVYKDNLLHSLLTTHRGPFFFLQIFQMLQENPKKLMMYGNLRLIL